MPGTRAAVKRTTATHQSLEFAGQRDSLSHDAVPLGTSMWLDEPITPVSRRTRSSSSSLEDSLQLLHSHAGAHAALSFDDDVEVHALFPMLSESSFDYDDDKEVASAAALHSSTTIAQVEAPFPDDISPILTALPMPQALQFESQALPVPVHTVAARKKTTRPPPVDSKTPSPTVGAAIPFPHDTIAAMSVESSAIVAPLSIGKRRRSLRSSSLAMTLAHWNDHEQNVFFSVFKAKWPATASATAAEDDSTALTTLLLQRFDLISEKLKSPNKTSHDVQHFYQNVLQCITDLLLCVVPHDIDLLNRDEIRIALWCWHKLASDEGKRQEMEQIDEATDEEKKMLAHELLQSIIRSRRQMLKAKSGGATSAQVRTAVGGNGDETMKLKFESLEGLLREALEHSSLPSYLYQMAPHEANEQPVVHHPLVRKKATKNAPVDSASTVVANSPAGKRKRSESVELYHAFTNGTPLTSLAPASQDLVNALTSPSFVTPPVGMNPTKSKSKSKQNQTPPQSSRKKIYVKLRMVPRDTQTKDIVERSGCNPKVELKLSSTKKVSDVLDHMAKKWTSVRALVDINATLHFFQKESSASSPDATSSPPSAKRQRNATCSSWSRRNHDVTCFDVWKQCGKIKNDEYIAVVSYQWRTDQTVPQPKANSGSDHLTAWMDDTTPLLDLLDDDMGSTKKQLPFDHDVESCSSKENSPFTSPIHIVTNQTAQIQPLASSSTYDYASTKQSLMEFSESVAFDAKPPVTDMEDAVDDHTELSLASLSEDALCELMEFSPNSQRLRRRRITPVLVQTNECKL